jgi:hypothetical protein
MAEDLSKLRLTKSLEEITEDRDMALLEGFMFAYNVIHQAKGIPYQPGDWLTDGTWKLLCEVADGLKDVCTEDDPEQRERLIPRDRATAQSIHRAWGRIRSNAFRREGLPEP